MTIASAIAALSPSIWLKLDETTGTTANNSGSRTDDGVFSGSYDQGITGPEVGTFATRLYTGGQVQLGPMDLTTFVDQSIGLWVSTDASGAINTTFPLVYIGDPANPLSRGPMIAENHTVAGQPRWAMMHHGSVLATNGVVAPLLFWHWVVITYTTGTNGAKLYLDGTLAATSTLAGTLTNVITDPLIIRCNEPVVVAHVCWFGGVLTQTQIQTVSSQLAPWPYTVPINTPPPESGGGGGLTTDQAAQLSNIDTNTQPSGPIQNDLNTLLSNWAGYTSVTLPSLQDMLNHISGQVTDVQNTLADFADGVLHDLVDGVNAILDGITATWDDGVSAVQHTLGKLFSAKTLEQLAQFEITDGPTCTQFIYNRAGFFFGIVVRINIYPSAWTPMAPDHNFFIPDFATVSMYKGDDLYFRQGIHQTNWAHSPFPVFFGFPVPFFNVDLPLSTVRIVVDWADGVCGQVYLKRI